jgi:PAS domain S-box-containing protein
MRNGPKPNALTESALRVQAESQIGIETQAEEASQLSVEQVQERLHELHVHQIELETQNESLRATQLELERVRERYVDLYEHAPVGYLTLNLKGGIRAANLTSVAMLGVERSRLLAMTFSRFVVQEDQDLYFLSLRRALNSPLTQSRDLRLRHESGNVFHGRLEMLKARDEGVEVCHVTLSDVTQHKIAEDVQRENQRKQLLYENAERLTLAFDAGGFGAWDQDFRTGQIVSSSRTRSMLGFRANESITWPTLVDRIHPEDRPHSCKQPIARLNLGAITFWRPPSGLSRQKALADGCALSPAATLTRFRDGRFAGRA